MAKEPRYTRSDGTAVELATPNSTPVTWRVFCKATGKRLDSGVVAKTAHEAYMRSVARVPFSEVVCVQADDLDRVLLESIVARIDMLRHHGPVLADKLLAHIGAHIPLGELRR